MKPEERRMRMRGLRERVARENVKRWAESFLEALERARSLAVPFKDSSPDEVGAALAKVGSAAHAVILLDYDGTLVPFADTPDLARPDAELLRLLESLATAPGTSLHVVSGRGREVLQGWLGELPAGLHAEHGLWSRWARGDAWTCTGEIRTDWKLRVRPILEEFAARTPGAFVEEKASSLVWHHRLAEAEFGSAQAKALRLHLLGMLSNLPVQVVPGNKSVEVRPYGVHKGLIVARATSRVRGEPVVLAMGDDRTDEDLFAAVPEGGVSVHVGPTASRAPLRIADSRATRRLLLELVRLRRGE
jgi:trehalose 6-phosphate synthase/phosphatase